MEPSSNQPVFEQMGGEPALRSLVDRFYDLMALGTSCSGFCAAGPADPITTSSASGIRACEPGTCLTPSVSASAMPGWPV
jgi:hypothetical protein